MTARTVEIDRLRSQINLARRTGELADLSAMQQRLSQLLAQPDPAQVAPQTPFVTANKGITWQRPQHLANFTGPVAIDQMIPVRTDLMLFARPTNAAAPPDNTVQTTGAPAANGSDAAVTRKQEAATATAIVGDVSKGKSIEQTAKDRGMDRQQVIDLLDRNGFDIKQTDNGQSRQTELLETTTGKTVTENYHYRRDRYSTSTKGADGKETTTPLRDPSGRKVTSSWNEELGAKTQRYESDLGDGSVLERTSLPTGVTVEKTTDRSGKTETVVVAPDGKRTTLAPGQEVGRGKAAPILAGLGEGKTIDQIAKDSGLTPDQVKAQLASGGLQVKENATSSTTSIEVKDQSGKVVASLNRDYEHDGFNSKVLDAKGNEVTRSDDGQGRTTHNFVDADGNKIARSSDKAKGVDTEVVVDPEGRRTEKITERINGGKPVEHEVETGDTLSKIAKQNGVETGDLRRPDGTRFDSDLIHPGEKVVVGNGTRTTIKTSFNGYTLTTNPDGNSTLKVDEWGTEIALPEGSELEGVARAVIGVNPNSTDPERAKEGQIVKTFADGVFAQESRNVLIPDAQAKETATAEAIEKYGVGPPGKKVAGHVGAKPFNKAPSGGDWVQARGVWVDPNIARAMAAEDSAKSKLLALGTKKSQAGDQLNVYALDPAYDGAMTAATRTLDKALAPYNLRWIPPEPTGTLADAQAKLGRSNTMLDQAKQANQAYGAAERDLDTGIKTQTQAAQYPDGTTDVVYATGSSYNYSTELATGNKLRGQANSAFANYSQQSAKGDKLLADYNVEKKRVAVDATKPGTPEHDTAKGELTAAEKYQQQATKNAGVAQSAADLAAATNARLGFESLKQELGTKFQQKNSWLFEHDRVYRTNGGDVLGKVKNREIVVENGQLYMKIVFEHGEQKFQLTYDPYSKQTPAEERNNPLNHQWYKLWVGSDPTACGRDGLASKGGLDSLRKNEHAAGEKLRTSELDRLELTFKDLDASIDNLKGKQDAAIGKHGAGTIEAPAGTLGPGETPVEVDVGGGKIQVAPELADAARRGNFGALTASGKSVRVKVNGQLVWVHPEVAQAALDLNAAQERRNQLNQLKSGLEADRKRYEFLSDQPVKFFYAPAEDQEYQNSLAKKFLETHEKEALAGHQQRFQGFYDAGYNDQYRKLKDRELVNTVSAAPGFGSSSVGKVTGLVRSFGGSDAEVKVVPFLYIDGKSSPQEHSLIVVKNGDKATYIDANGMNYDSVEDFREENRMFVKSGKIVFAADFEMKRGADGTIDLDVMQAYDPTVIREVIDPIVEIGTTVATVAAIIPNPLSGVAAGIAYAGAAYIGTRAVIKEVIYLDHGGQLDSQESLMNIGGGLTTALPIVSSLTRAVGMTGRAIGEGAEQMSFAQAFAGSIGAAKHGSPIMMEASTYMSSADRLNQIARGLDWTAIGIGSPMMAISVRDLALYGDQMEGLDLVNAISGLATGIVGTGLGARNLWMTRPAKPGTDIATTSHPTNGPDPLPRPVVALQDEFGPFEAQVLGTPPKSADDVYVPPADGPHARGDEPEVAGKTHYVVEDADTGELFVLPWIRGASSDHVPGGQGKPVAREDGGDAGPLAFLNLPTRPMLEAAPPNRHTLEGVRNKGKRDKWESGEEYVRDLNRSSGGEHFPVALDPDGDFPVTGTGGRHVDAVVRHPETGKIEAIEVKTYGRWTTIKNVVHMNEVPLSKEIQQQINKDVALRRTVPGYEPRWVFVDAPPSADLVVALTKAGIVGNIMRYHKNPMMQRSSIPLTNENGKKVTYEVWGPRPKSADDVYIPQGNEPTPPGKTHRLITDPDTGQRIVNWEPVSKPATKTVEFRDQDGNTVTAEVLGTPPKGADKIYVPPSDGPPARGDEPELAHLTHHVVQDPDTGQPVVMPWMRGASSEHVPGSLGDPDGEGQPGGGPDRVPEPQEARGRTDKGTDDPPAQPSNKPRGKKPAGWTNISELEPVNGGPPLMNVKRVAGYIVAARLAAGVFGEATGVRGPYNAISGQEASTAAYYRSAASKYAWFKHNHAMIDVVELAAKGNREKAEKLLEKIISSSGRRGVPPDEGRADKLRDLVDRIATAGEKYQEALGKVAKGERGELPDIKIRKLPDPDELAQIGSLDELAGRPEFADMLAAFSADPTSKYHGQDPVTIIRDWSSDIDNSLDVTVQQLQADASKLIKSAEAREAYRELHALLRETFPHKDAGKVDHKGAEKLPGSSMSPDTWLGYFFKAGSFGGALNVLLAWGSKGTPLHGSPVDWGAYAADPIGTAPAVYVQWRYLKALRDKTDFEAAHPTATRTAEQQKQWEVLEAERKKWNTWADYTSFASAIRAFLVGAGYWGAGQHALAIGSFVQGLSSIGWVLVQQTPKWMNIHPNAKQTIRYSSIGLGIIVPTAILLTKLLMEEEQKKGPSAFEGLFDEFSDLLDHLQPAVALRPQPTSNPLWSPDVSTEIVMPSATASGRSNPLLEQLYDAVVADRKMTIGQFARTNNVDSYDTVLLNMSHIRDAVIQPGDRIYLPA